MSEQGPFILQTAILGDMHLRDAVRGIADAFAIPSCMQVAVDKFGVYLSRTKHSQKKTCHGAWVCR